MAILEAEVQAAQAELAVEPAELESEYLHALRRLSLDDYHWLIEHGYFERNGLAAARVELVDGYLIDMSPNHPPHAFSVGQLAQLLQSALSDRGYVRCQLPVTFLAQQSEPEPDLAVVSPPGRNYQARHPSPEDIFLACEVAASSLAYDRRVKLDLYARAGIREYWIVNLNDRVVEVYRQPVTVGRRAAYQLRLELLPEQTVALLAFPDVEIALRDIFPEEEAD